MNRFTLLPSVNWNVSHMLTVNETGTTCAYGSRGDIVIIKNVNKDNVNEYESTFIARAHKNHRVTGLIFVKVQIEEEVTELLASCGDDGRIKIWNPITGENTHKCLLKKAGAVMKLVDIDFCAQNACIVSAGSEVGGNLVKWNTTLNKIWTYNVDPKITVNCIAVCPHVEDLVAVGAHFGLVFVYNLKGEGKLLHRIRCHDNVVCSLSWCPVPYNALQLSNLKDGNDFNEEEYKKTDKTYLLASCSKDRSIYICKAGLNGYCEAVLTLPSKPLTKNAPVANTDRGRYMKWIYPSVLLTSTDFNEIITVYLSPKSEQKTDIRQKVKLSSVKFEPKPLHNVHKKNISNFAVHLFNKEEVDFRVWSCSADRLLVRSGYKINYKEKNVILPLLSGYIFSLDISPTNPDLLAIGIGDGKICVWNLSTDTCVDLTTLSRKIESKVMSLRWHPNYEGILAFGTYEGRVGIFDLSQGRTTPTLFKLYHNKAIYKLCWAPPVSIGNVAETKHKNGTLSNELYLFAVGNGDILQYNPSNYNEVPVSLTQEVLSSIEETCNYKHKSDMCYEPERKIVAIGLSNGNVCVCNAESYKLLHVLTEQSKSIMSLAWHPKVVMDYPNEVSPCANWLATAGDNVFVYDVDVKENECPKKIASLEVHTHRILCVAWNPHINGRLLSCSQDNTAIIWDVINQTIIGRYVEHYAQVLCGVWSPLNKDVVITGSADFTCRMWNVSRDTVNTINEVKRKPNKAIEPAIVTASVSRETSFTESLSNSFSKNSSTSKHSTLFPTISQGFFGSALLEKTFETAINNRKIADFGDTVEEQNTTNELEYASLDTCKSTGGDTELSEESDDDCEVSEKSSKKKNRVEPSYVQIFGNNDELTRLIKYEERTLNKTENNVDSLVLSQARYDLKNKITNAMKNNKVTEHLLALAPSISPKLWKEACQVYIEQMIQADNIFQAVNFQLALGKDEDAINLLCEKNRFKEAFVMARTRVKDEAVVKKVLEKWIHYCYSCGLYRLGAHCYMYLQEEQNASTFLSKSKVMKDTILAITLLKYYQPKRAIELGTDCFKKHLMQMNSSDVEHLLKEFPEIRFMEPWYLVMKHFTEEQPNTAGITKWMLNIFSSNWKCPTSNNCTDFEKLQNVVVDNSFTMNYEQLIIYVSAQVSLYVTGISNLQYELLALRSYIRALFYCYKYRLMNSKRGQSDAAYPMMRVLKLMFPSGLFEVYNADVESDDTFKSLYRSIKAYYCDFIATWLINCDDLPKSLKSLEHQNGTDSAESYGDRFPIITDKRTKLQKLSELFSLYLHDVLDVASVSYFKNMSKLKELENGQTTKLSPSAEGNQGAGDKTDFTVVVKNGGECDNEIVAVSKGAVANLNEEVSDPRNGDLKVDDQNGTENSKKVTVNGNDKNVDIVTKCVNRLSIGSLTEGTKAMIDDSKGLEVKELKAEIEEFEKERVSAPNPSCFYYTMKEYIDKCDDSDTELTSNLRKMLITRAEESGLL